MSPKKPYQKRLPTVLPPAPRRAPARETVRPRPAPPRARRTPPVAPPPVSAPEPAPEPAPETAPAAAPTPTQAPDRAPDPAPLPATAVPPPPEPAPRRSGPRTRRTLVLVEAGLLGLLAGGVVAWQLVGPDEPPPPPASLPIDGWPVAGESRAVTEVLPGGDLEVTHWIHAERPIAELEVTLPDLDGVRVTANQVEVTADGRPAPGPGVVLPSGATYTFSDATRIQVRYLMSGAVQPSSSADGRGLATTTSLDVTATQPRDVRVVRSQEVLSLACAAPNEQPVPCGEPGGDDQWRVELDETDAGTRVLAVVTVPS